MVWLSQLHRVYCEFPIVCITIIGAWSIFSETIVCITIITIGNQNDVCTITASFLFLRILTANYSDSCMNA